VRDPHAPLTCYLIRNYSCSPLSLWPIQACISGHVMTSNPIQRSLAPRRVMLSLQIIAYYDLIRDSQSLLIAYFLRLSGPCPTVSYGLESRGSPICSPYLSLRAVFRTPAVQPGAYDCCFPDRFSLHLISNGSATALHADRFSRGSVTRLQSSLYVTARGVASPSPARTFTAELSSNESPHLDVDYNYAGKQSIPATGLSPARYEALWAAN